MNLKNLAIQLLKCTEKESEGARNNFKVFIRTPTEIPAEYKFWDIESVDFDDDNKHINLFAQEVKNAK